MAVNFDYVYFPRKLFEMLYKRDFYTLIFEKVPTPYRGRGYKVELETESNMPIMQHVIALHATGCSWVHNEHAYAHMHIAWVFDVHTHGACTAPLCTVTHREGTPLWPNSQSVSKLRNWASEQLSNWASEQVDQVITVAATGQIYK